MTHRQALDIVLYLGSDQFSHAIITEPEDLQTEFGISSVKLSARKPEYPFSALAYWHRDEEHRVIDGSHTYEPDILLETAENGYISLFIFDTLD